jgi:hypothetical protein
MRVKKGGKGRPATRRFLTRRKSRKQRPSIDGAAGPSSRRVVREGKAMIHSSRRDRKAKAIAEVLAMIANAQAPLAPHRPRPVLEADERLLVTVSRSPWYWYSRRSTVPGLGRGKQELATGTLTPVTDWNRWTPQVRYAWTASLESAAWAHAMSFHGFHEC